MNPNILTAVALISAEFLGIRIICAIKIHFSLNGASNSVFIEYKWRASVKLSLNALFLHCHTHTHNVNEY